MSSRTVHDVVYEEVVPMIQKTDNPGMAMRDYIENATNLDLKEVCVAMAIKYRGAFDYCEDLKRWYCK